MAKHRKPLVVGLVAGLALVALLAGGSAFIGGAVDAGADAVDSVRVVDDPKPPATWAIDAAYGRGALSNLRLALGEIDQANDVDARKGVAVAKALLDRIERDPSRGDANLVLVHSEVRVLGDADPGNAVKAELDNLRARIDMSDHDAIIAALDSLDIPLAYTRVDMPLSETMALVDAALRALDDRDPALARTKLLQVGDGLRVDTVRIGIERHRIESGDDQGAS